MDKIRYLTEKTKSLAVEVDIIKEEISAASVEDIKNMQELRSSVSTLETSVKNMNSELSTTISNVSALSARVDTTVSSLSAAKEDITTNKEDIAQLKTDLSGTKTDLSNVTSDLATTKTSLTTTQNDLSSTKTDLATTKSDLSGTKTDLANTRTDLNNTKTELSTAKSDISTAKSDITTAKSDISSLKTLTTSQDEKIDANTTKITQNTSKIVTNEANIAENTQKITDNSESILINANNISSQAQKVNQNTANIATNTQNIATNTANISANAAKIATNETNISTNATNIATNAANITKHTEDFVKVADRLYNLDTLQASLSTQLENHKNDFYIERNKLRDMTGELYGENLLLNPYLTCNQRNVKLNQTKTMFMADKWYKACTNQVKVNLSASGIFELRFLKTLTTPVRAIEQRIDLPAFFAGRSVVVSLTVKDCTTTADNSASFGLEYFDSTGASLGVESLSIGVIGDKYLKCTIPENTTNMTFFFQINTPVQRTKLIRFTNPKVEFGTVASKFGGRTDEHELSLCQKYYYASGVSADNALTLKAISATEFEPSVLFFPTKMAKTPTITLLSPTKVENTLTCVESGGADITVSAQPVFDGRQCFKIVGTNAVAGNHYKLGGYTADAETLPLNVNISDGTETDA